MDRYICYDCGYIADSPSSWWNHRRHKHQSTAFDECRKYAQGTVCAACLTQFHTRQRLWFHLYKSKPHCLNVIRANRQPLPQNVIDDETLAAHFDSRVVDNLDALSRDRHDMIFCGNILCQIIPARASQASVFRDWGSYW